MTTRKETRILSLLTLCFGGRTGMLVQLGILQDGERGIDTTYLFAQIQRTRDRTGLDLVGAGTASLQLAISALEDEPVRSRVTH